MTPEQKIRRKSTRKARKELAAGVYIALDQIFQDGRPMSDIARELEELKTGLLILSAEGRFKNINSL